MTDFTDGGAQSGALSPGGGPGGTLTPPAQDPGLPFYLTFGIQYAEEPHPHGSWIDPYGWVTIYAPSYSAARAIVTGLFGLQWSDLYDEISFDYLQVFPRGELLRIIVPAGLVEEEDHRD